MPAKKIYTIVKTRDCSSDIVHTGTLDELKHTFNYTLECGKSWEHEKGNAKININPKSIKSLVNMLNKAVNNSAANGYAGIHFSLDGDT